jgi:hypothetical protein
MSASFIDEFSFNHPDNKGYGKSRRLRLLSSGDAHYSTSKLLFTDKLVLTHGRHSVEKLFSKGWKHPKKAKPKIHGIFKILSADPNLKPYHKYRSVYIFMFLTNQTNNIYRALVTSSPPLLSRTKNPANEQFLFHGTNRYCRLAEDLSRVRLCILSRCHLCSIIRNSFDVERCGECYISSPLTVIQIILKGPSISFVVLGKEFIRVPAPPVRNVSCIP